METKSQDIIFIIDESGSMEDMGKEPIDCINSFVSDQKKIDDKSKFTLYKFNTKTTLVFDDIPLSSVPIFDDYTPSNMTALYDAIGIAISNKKLSKDYKNVICAILTDGEENSSMEYTSELIKKMIKEMEIEHNWKFIFMGANQNAFISGRKFGVKKCINFQATPLGLNTVTRELSIQISAMRSGEEIPEPPEIIDEIICKTPPRIIRTNTLTLKRDLLKDSPIYPSKK